MSSHLFLSLRNRVSESSKATIETATIASNVNQTRRRNIQNFLMIWLDANIDQSNKNCQETLAQLRSVANNVDIFTQADECVDYFTEIEDMKVFLIIESMLGQQIIPFIHDIPQLHAVYIFCDSKSRRKQWTKQWHKIKGVYKEIIFICEALQLVAKQFNQDSIAISFVTATEVTSTENLDKLEPSFIYTQIFKEILLEMEHDEQSIKDFIAYCYNGNYGSPNTISEFENKYDANSAIWWYTYPSFIYSMLNCALRMLDADTIINMGFFIHDLHHQIDQLHRKQASSYTKQSFLVYRGQGLSTTDFEKLCKTKGGLISFNNFLSTSTSREVSLHFAMNGLTNIDMVGILFRMYIDPSISSAPFATIQEVSYFQDEDEILFSMHTIFRIGEITQIDNNNPLYQVELKLTSDDDPQLRTFAERIREEAIHDTGWGRIGRLLVNIGQFDKAEELYKLLLEKAFNESEEALYYNNIGHVNNSQGKYDKAIWYYEKGLEIYQKILPNHSYLGVSHNNIGEVYRNLGEYSKSLSFYEKALEIWQKTLPANHPFLATCYSNIGEVYRKVKKYSKAVSFYEKALEIRQITLSLNHPDLATSYNNIGVVYTNIEEYSKALLSHEKALDMYQKTLPVNHPILANSYNNIGGVYENMGEYSKALSYYQKAHELIEKTRSANHPDLATSYNNIGLVYGCMGEHSKALLYCECALKIFQSSLPANHPDITTVRNSIEFMKKKL